MNLKRLLLSLTVALSILLAACGPAATPMAVNLTDPLAVVNRYYAAIEASDIDQAMTFVADDIVMTDPNGATTGKAAVTSAWKGYLEAGFTFDQSDFQAQGNRVTSCFKVFQNGDLIDEGCSAVTYVRDGKIIFDGLESAEAMWVVENYIAALNAQDLDRAMAYIAEEAVFVNPYGTFKGEAQIRASLQQVMDDGLTFAYSNYRGADGRVVYDYQVLVNGEVVEVGLDGLNVVKAGKIVLDSTERWEWMAYAHQAAFTATDSGFDGPSALPAGWTEISLTNDSQGVHHLQLAKLEAGKTADDLKATLEADPENFPAWAIPYGGPNAPDPGGRTSAIVQLEAGQYALFSVIPNAEGVPGFLNGLLKTLTVTEATDQATVEPKSDLDVDLTEFALGLSGSVAAGPHVIGFHNRGLQIHEAYLVKLNDGVTAEQYLNTSPTEIPPATALGGITGIPPGAHQYLTLTLEPGHYALFCFFPDPNSHAPHFVLGMVQEFTVK